MPPSVEVVEPATVVTDKAGNALGRIVYQVGENWLVTVERVLNAPIGGPSKLTIEALHGGDELGVWGSEGLLQTDIRAIPMVDARRELEALWIEYRAADLIADIPEDFAGDYAFAKLAEVMVTLHGWNIRNPAGMIARLRDPNNPGLWATRVKRARQRGFMTAGPNPMLTGKSLALMRG